MSSKNPRYRQSEADDEKSAPLPLIALNASLPPRRPVDPCRIHPNLLAEDDPRRQLWVPDDIK